MILLKDVNIGHDIIRDAIDKSKTHQDYEHVRLLKDAYTPMVTGKGTDKWLSLFLREDMKVFQQRLNITVQKVSAVLNNVLARINKIDRIQNVIKSIQNFGSNKKIAVALKDYVDNYYSEQGLEKYLHLFMIRNSICDPNAFIATAFTKEGSKIMPYCTYYDCEEVINFKYDRFSQLEWLLVKYTVTGVNQQGEEIDYQEYKLFAGDIIIRYTQVGPVPENDEMKKTVRVDYKESDGKMWTSKDKNRYWTEVYHAQATSTQAFRVGHLPDIETKYRTCVSLIEGAMPYLISAVRLGSNLDLSIFFNVFPQLIGYGERCEGPDIETPCIKGKLENGDTCPSCHGRGKKFITQPDESIMLEFPDNPEDLFDVSKIFHYNKPDIESIEWLDKHIQWLQNQVYVTVYNTELIPQSNLTTIGETVTATEVSVKREDINDTVLPLAQHYGWAIVRTTKQMAEYLFKKDDIRRLSVIHSYPRDLKMSTLSELLSDLQNATGSNAPPFIVQQIIDDIALKMLDGNEIGKKRYNYKKKYIPFLGMSVQYVLDGYNNGGISTYDYISFLGQDIIFDELEEEHADLYFKNDDEIKALVNAKMTNYVTKTKTDLKEIPEATTGSVKAKPKK